MINEEKLRTQIERLTRQLDEFSRFLNESQPAFKKALETGVRTKQAADYEKQGTKKAQLIRKTMARLSKMLFTKNLLTSLSTKALVLVLLKSLDSGGSRPKITTIWAHELLAASCDPLHPSHETWSNWRPELERLLPLVIDNLLIQEVVRRTSENENKYGKVMSRFLVYRDDPFANDEDDKLLAAKAIRELLKVVTGRTRGLTGSDFEDRKKSLAYERIFTAPELTRFLAMEELAEDPDGFAAMVEGKFNTIPGRIRDRIRGSIETELRREAVKEPLYDETQDDPWRVEHRLHTEETPEDRFFTTEGWILAKRFRTELEQNLTSRQREFLRLRLDEECSQATASRRLEITRQTASELAAAIRKKYMELFM